MSTAKNRVTLKNWRFVTDHGFALPTAKHVRLAGNVYGHPNPKCKDGDRVSTSVIESAEGLEVHTLNTIYFLDGIEPEYVAWLSADRLKLDETDPFNKPLTEIPECDTPLPFARLPIKPNCKFPDVQ